MQRIIKLLVQFPIICYKEWNMYSDNGDLYTRVGGLKGVQ